jgi:hypothetical protein
MTKLIGSIGIWEMIEKRQRVFDETIIAFRNLGVAISNATKSLMAFCERFPKEFKF